jgi:hypothetical protein
MKEGYEIISEDMKLLKNVYGEMNKEIEKWMRMLERLKYIMGDNVEEMEYKKKDVIM